MKPADELVKGILDRLETAPALSGITFVTAYGRKPFESPVRRLTASVGTDGVFTELCSGALNGQLQKQKSLTIAVDLYAPVKAGGESCAQTLISIAKTLESKTDDELYNKKIETFPVKYDSNACAFSGKLKLILTETLPDGESQLEEDARNISVKISGKEVPFVRQVRLSEEKHGYPIVCSGEGEVYAYSGRGETCTVYLSRFVTKENTVDLYGQGGFSMQVEAGGRMIRLEGCRIRSIEQGIQSGIYLLENAVIDAEKKTETEGDAVG